MAHIHLLSYAEAIKQLTEVVRETQRSKRASWKSSARPSWWIDQHSVTLHDGTSVCTGTFDVAERRKWKKTHVQAALFLHDQCKYGKSSPEDIPITRAPRMTRRAKKEQHTVRTELDSVPPGRTRAQPGKKQEVEEEEIRVRPPARGREHLRQKNEALIHRETPLPTTPKAQVHQRRSSNSMDTDESPTPVIRRKKATGRRKVQKTSPKIQTPIPKRQLRTRKQRNGKAVVRNAAKTEARRESIPRSRGSSDSQAPSTPNRSSGSPSNSDEDYLPVRTRGRANRNRNMTLQTVQDNRKKSPRLAGSSAKKSPRPDSPVTRKRLSSQLEEDAGNLHPRTPLQERNDPSNLQDRRSRKKRRLADSNNTPSDKENTAPAPADKSKSSRTRTARGTAGKPREPDTKAMETETMNEDNGNNEQEVADEVAEQQRKAKRIKFLREQIAEAKTQVARQLELVDEQQVKFEEKIIAKRNQIARGIRVEYRSKKLKFSPQVLDMPISKFANDHSGSVDEWMMHETVQGVNRTFNALHNGEDPNEGAMGPPKTPTARTRRAVLAKTARKTMRRVANDAAIAGLTVRRSQRTAAKVATERTRAIIASTPRTAKKEVTIQHGHAAPGRAKYTAGPAATASDEDVICSRQQFDILVKSIRGKENPVEALRKFTSQLQREALAAKEAHRQ